ncbi:MAG: hypothetical protein DRP67_05515 [Candidatus Omnitrophota bacterium]|nr:MAG: hypothetical protein DRP67_05515 [Candidatus Omnitrophota bacterium]
MESKRRVKLALNHTKPDRIPKDYWGVPEVDEELISYFKVKNKDEMLEKLGVDLRYVKPSYTGDEFFEYKDGSLQKKLPDGNYVDIWGVVRKRVEWGRGSYLEVVSSPLSKADSVKDIENYKLPDVKKFDYKGVMEKCERYPDKAIIFTGDRLTTRCSFFKLSMYLRGFSEFMMDLILNEKMVFFLIEKVEEFHFYYTEQTLKYGRNIDIFMMGDDFGAENGLLISPEIFRKYFKKPLKKMAELAHRYGVKVMLHSCGSVRELIPDFIEIGIDILNPIQTTAKGMVPHELKREFGKYICFHGGVDVKNLLPNSSPQFIKKEIEKLVNILGEGGGYILAPSHNLQMDIPLENILAIYET